jgi:hypothetical protein
LLLDLDEMGLPTKWLLDKTTLQEIQTNQWITLGKVNCDYNDNKTSCFEQIKLSTEDTKVNTQILQLFTGLIKTVSI